MNFLRKGVFILEAVRCISIRKSKPEQLKLHRIYWIDEDTKYTDLNGSTYVTVYADASKERLIGNLDVSHFENYFNYLYYGLTLSRYINSDDGVLLNDVIDFCEKNERFDIEARHVLKYINDKQYYMSKYLFREFFIKSIPLKCAIENEKVAEYMMYAGYSVVPVDDV